MHYCEHCFKDTNPKLNFIIVIFDSKAQTFILISSQLLLKPRYLHHLSQSEIKIKEMKWKKNTHKNVEYNLYSRKKRCLYDSINPQNWKCLLHLLFLSSSFKQTKSLLPFFACTDNYGERVSFARHKNHSIFFLSLANHLVQISVKKTKWKAPQSAIKNLMILQNENCLMIQYI